MLYQIMFRMPLKKNELSNFGENISKFEENHVHCLNRKKHVTCLSSGTAAIHLALVLLEVKRDDEVICQSFTCSGSANPIIYQGATPVFIDSEEDT